MAEVAAVEEQQVGVFAAFFFQEVDASEETTPVGQRRVGQVRAQRIDGAVRVVGVQDGELLLSVRNERTHHYTYYNIYSLHNVNYQLLIINSQL